MNEFLKYGPFAILIGATGVIVKGYFSDLGKSLWAATSGSARGWLAFVSAMTSLGSAIYAALIPIIGGYAGDAIMLTALAVGLLALSAAMTLHAILKWMALIAAIQRGESSHEPKSLALF